MEKSNAVRRPWYRLHISTWLTLPLGLAVAILVVLPGGDGYYPERTSWVDAGVFQGEARLCMAGQCHFYGEIQFIGRAGCGGRTR